MTENEAIREIETSLELAEMCTPNREREKEIKAYKIAIQTLEEIQQYRAIGTVEQLEWCKDASHWKELFKEKLEKYEAIGTVEDIQMIFQLCKDLQVMCGKYHEIGTVEEFKALKEKNTPYKPKEYEDRYYACKCDNILLPKWRKYPTELMPKSEGLPHCMACGQKLDWR